MQVRFYFVHLIVYNTMVKTKFKINIIWVRLIILKFLYCVVGDMTADVNHLYIKRIHLESLVNRLYIVREDKNFV
jgi:hypothetical protein